MLLLLVLLPVVIAGPALGGMAAWLHVHGPFGIHVHLVAGESEHIGPETLDAWHAEEHRDDGDGEAHEGDEPAHPGFLIEFPELLAAAPRGQAPLSVVGPLLPAAFQALRFDPAWIERPHGPEPCRSIRPCKATSRTGIVALLLSSHALLI